MAPMMASATDFDAADEEAGASAGGAPGAAVTTVGIVRPGVAANAVLMAAWRFVDAKAERVAADRVETTVYATDTPDRRCRRAIVVMLVMLTAEVETLSATLTALMNAVCAAVVNVACV